MHGGGDGWNSNGMTHWLPDFQAGAQLVSLPPGAWHWPLPMMAKNVAHNFPEDCSKAHIQRN
jgi:hypothetical protein